ncbi:uncharacterized protein SPSC_01824 [Sporisorium scitamineum]|uniref:Uncharacterized protein n=1 Tax=Sporisorium scitamineum TaxID=49012 RepID=A0A127ZB36_9BASI|nr:uncharacterized protein SPSC_01824 [Sporisorium scitamineum]
MPMEAIHLLSAAEPHMPSVEELKQLAGAARPWLQNRDMYKANVEESESNNQAILWATLQQDDASLAQKSKHLTFAETSADCKQNQKVVCDPVLITEPPNTTHHSRMQVLSLPQKEFLHWQVHNLIDNGFLIKIDEDQVHWISETHIIPKPAAKIESNVSIEELQHQVNVSLKDAGLEHDEDLAELFPTITTLQLTTEMTKAHY